MTVIVSAIARVSIDQIMSGQHVSGLKDVNVFFSARPSYKSDLKTLI